MGKCNELITAGKVVFVGIDVHKKTYSLTAICEGEVIKWCTVPADYKALEQTLANAFPGSKLKTAYEAGFSGFGLHRFLLAKGIDNKVVNPASILVQANNKVKTDRRDSLAIAQQLSAGMVRSVHVPSVEQELDRSLVRQREQFVEDRTRASNRIKSKLAEYGYSVEDRPFSLAMAQRIRELPMPSKLQSIIERLIQQYLYLDQQVRAVEMQLKEQAAADSNETILRSVPGIGPVTSRVLATELIDVARFSSGKHLASFCGLTPSEHSSGPHVRRGSITKQGRAQLRRCLVEASWVAIRHDPGLKDKYERLKHRSGGRKAIVAIARTLLIRIRACLQNQCSYNVAA